MDRCQIDVAPQHSADVSVPIRKEKFRAIITGTLIEGKGQEEAIQAIAELAGRGMRIELLVIGSGIVHYEQHLRNLIAVKELEDLIYLIGHVRNPYPFMKSADIGLVCSRCEAFGRVTIEAMFARKPVIGARSGATPELVQDGVNGLLYKPGNVKDLADKIQFLYENPMEASRLGERGFQWAMDTFNRARYENQLLGLLSGLMNSR
jgi:glycosyltransferase involved in cell wall biosynthesis